MLRNKLVRSDGSIIDSSVIISCEYTEEVNSTTNLTVGDATASELTVEILNTADIISDERLTYYIIEDDVETKIGVFNVEKPTVATRTTMRFVAYDNIVKTEANFSNWLRENQNLFPMTLLALVTYACANCGVTLATTDFPSSGLSINAFYADGITCRQILTWAASIAGRFIRANAEGELEFAWYRDSRNITIYPSKMDSSGNTLTVTDDGNGNLDIQSDGITMYDDGEGNVTLEAPNLTVLTSETGVALAVPSVIPYLEGSLSYENYHTDLINRVQINHSEDDVGVIYPAAATGNCFTISENMILGTLEPAVVSQIAANLYAQLNSITYRPFSVTVPRSIKIRAGDIVSVTDSNGVSFASYVMKVAVSPSGTEINSTGDKSYGGSAAVSSEKYSNLTGKILSISKSVDGLVIENKDLAGKVGSLELSTEEFKTTISDTYVSKDELGEYKTTVSNQFSQTVEGFEMSFGTTKELIEGIDKDLQDTKEEQKSYIRFVDGNIHLGKSTSDIMLILENDRISFVRNVVGYPQLAYISDDTLYITEGEFLTQLRIGHFGFTPGANGNLSFKKVVT